MARLHTVTGTGFGYPAEPFGPPAATWRQAFTAMMDAVLDDAERYRARLPVPPDRVRRLFAAVAGVLDDVVSPALVHFDLWEGNLLLDGEPGARTLGGVIDGERMFWGDPRWPTSSPWRSWETWRTTRTSCPDTPPSPVRRASTTPYGCAWRSTVPIST